MNYFEMNAINDQHIADLQAESQNMVLARSLTAGSTKKASSGGFVRRVGTVFGRAVGAVYVPGTISRHQPA